jgi:hypothetical protein
MGNCTGVTPFGLANADSDRLVFYFISNEDGRCMG